MVSVILTTHNRLPLLPRAIDSVIQQTYKDIECLVVDDASDDGTENYCKNRNDIIYIRISPEESIGGNYARNLGIKASKGEYVAFLDDDDYWMPKKIEKQIEMMEKNHYVLCSCGRRIEDVKPDGSIKLYEDDFGRFFQKDMSRQILNKVCTTTSLILVRKDKLITIGQFDERLRYWQEYEMCIRLAQEGKFGFADDVLTVYRIDRSDKRRLTNKYGGWPESVNYIINKHYHLFSTISFHDFLKFLQFVSRDAYLRLKQTDETETDVYKAHDFSIFKYLLKRPKLHRIWKCYVLLIFYSNKHLPSWLRRRISIA